MRTFYTPVDLRSRADMTGFLKKHFRYHTMNSWNRSTSYACNLKILLWSSIFVTLVAKKIS